MFERYRHLARLVMLTGDGDSGGTGTGGEGNPPQRRSSADVLTQYGGDAIRMADRVAELERENYRYREQKRDLTAENTALKATQTPEGAVVLTGDAVKAYEALAALGKPEEVKAALAERDTLKGEVTTVRRNETLRAVAEAEGADLAILRLAGANLDYVVKDVTEGDTARKRAFVKGEGNSETPLTDYAKANWAEVEGKLFTTGTGQQQQQQQGGGITMPRTPSGNGGKPASVAQSYVQSTYKGPPQPGARS